LLTDISAKTFGHIEKDQGTAQLGRIFGRDHSSYENHGRLVVQEITRESHQAARASNTCAAKKQNPSAYSHVDRDFGLHANTAQCDSPLPLASIDSREKTVKDLEA
jgi:hypothetical protein